MKECSKFDETNITHSTTTNITTYKAKHTQRARKFKKDIRSSIAFSQFRIKIIRRIIDASIKNIKNQFTLTFSRRSYSELQLSIYLRKYNSMLSIDQTDFLILRFNSATRLNLSTLRIPWDQDRTCVWLLDTFARISSKKLAIDEARANV